MKNRYLVLVTLFLLCGCGNGTPVPALPASANTSTPFTLTLSPTPSITPPAPLSGSGGGVLTYCLAPAAGLMELYEINLDGTEDRELASSHYGVNHMDWAPGGEKFAAVVYMDSSFNTWSIYVFDSDGSHPVRLTDTTGAADAEPAWSPDGTRILFTRIVFTSAREYTSQVLMMNADGGGQAVVVADGFAAKWAPDGTRIIYSSGKTGNHELYTSNPDGTEEQQLTHTDADESYPSWSPDGTQIVFTSSTGKWNSVESEATYEIFVMNTDGTGLQQLTENNFPDSTPRWSPDGTRIVFVSDSSGTGQYDVFVMNADGSNVTQVTHVPAGARAINPAWRPLTPAQSKLVSKLDEQLTQYTERGEFSGSVLFAFAGGILLERSYGFSDRSSDTPNTPGTNFSIASLTKQFTAMSILMLQEQGKLDVQDRFCTYYPNCPAAWQEITIHQLLTHTSGIPTYTQLPDYLSWAEFPKTPDEIIAFFINEPLLFQPGESWAYSNSGYVLLGYLIEHLSGLSYGDFLEANIFLPLGMSNSGYTPNGVDGVAVGYYDQSEEPAFPISPSTGFSAGGIYSTVEDLYRWDQALYTERLIPQSSLDLMFTPYAAAFDSSVPNYGYGWIIETQDGHRVYYHQGAVDGFKTFIMRFPDDHVTVVVLSNQMDVTVGLISRDFASQILSVVSK